MTEKKIASAFPPERRARLRRAIERADVLQIDCEIIAALMQDLMRLGVREVKIERSTLRDILDMMDRLEKMKTIDQTSKTIDVPVLTAPKS